MSLALRQAWSEARKPKRVVIDVRHQPSGGKEWVARIIGRHPKWKFEREFISPVGRDWSYSGKTGTTTFELEEGAIYEINEPWRGRCFVEVRDGGAYKIDVTEVLSRIA